MTNSNEPSLIVFPSRTSELKEVRRSGDWCTITFHTPFAVEAPDKSLFGRIKTALDILRRGYTDRDSQRIVLVLHHRVAAELNDLLIEGIYYTPQGEYKGERFTYQDSEADPAP